VSRVVLIGCVKGKLDRPAPARDLYISDLFALRRRYAEASGHPWGVLSALHGVLDPDRVIAPYDWTIAQRWTKTGGFYHWAGSVIQGCYFLRSGVTNHSSYDERAATDFTSRLTVEIHAGKDYVDLIRMCGLPQWPPTVHIEHPVAGMGIGEQKQFYRHNEYEYPTFNFE